MCHFLLLAFSTTTHDYYADTQNAKDLARSRAREFTESFTGAAEGKAPIAREAERLRKITFQDTLSTALLAAI